MLFRIRIQKDSQNFGIFSNFFNLILSTGLGKIHWWHGKYQVSRVVTSQTITWSRNHLARDWKLRLIQDIVMLIKGPRSLSKVIKKTLEEPKRAKKCVLKWWRFKELTCSKEAIRIGTHFVTSFIFTQLSLLIITGRSLKSDEDAEIFTSGAIWPTSGLYSHFKHLNHMMMTSYDDDVIWWWRHMMMTYLCMVEFIETQNNRNFWFD